MSRVACLWIEDPETLQAAAARCKQFTPLVGIDPDVFPQSVLLDITRVVDLFGGEAALAQRIADELRAEGWQFRIAVADTPGAAWAWRGMERARGREGERGRGETVARRRKHAILRTRYSVFSLSLPLSPSRPFLSPLSACRNRSSHCCTASASGGSGSCKPCRGASFPARFGPELLDCLDRVTGQLAGAVSRLGPSTAIRGLLVGRIPHGAAGDDRGRLGASRPPAGHHARPRRPRRDAAGMSLDVPWRKRGQSSFVRSTLRAVPANGDCPLFWRGGGRGAVSAHGLGEPPLAIAAGAVGVAATSGPVESVRLAAVAAPLELRQQEMFAEKARAEPYHLSGLIDRLSNRLGHTRVARVRLVPDAQPELACHYAPLVSVGWRQDAAQTHQKKRNGGSSLCSTTPYAPCTVD